MAAAPWYPRLLWTPPLRYENKILVAAAITVQSKSSRSIATAPFTAHLQPRLSRKYPCRSIGLKASHQQRRPARLHVRAIAGRSDLLSPGADNFPSLRHGSCVR